MKYFYGQIANTEVDAYMRIEPADARGFHRVTSILIYPERAEFEIVMSDASVHEHRMPASTEDVWRRGLAALDAFRALIG